MESGKAFRLKAPAFLRGVMEILVLFLVCLSPWAYGAVHPSFEFLLHAGLASLLVLWGGRMLLEGKLTWKKCPVAICLAGLYLSSLWQVTPLPDPWLRRLSPGTAQLYDQLLPSQAEVLPLEGKAISVPLAGKTISLYPSSTRHQLIRLLAVFLLFAVVRNNLASPAILRRLGVAVLINGALLSLFALIQFFTSPHHMLYWSFPSGGQVFGPFINRDHFPFYINMCFGLGLGLLLGTKPMNSRSSISRNGLQSLVQIVSHPQVLGISAALALMLSSVIFCLSRGGILAWLSGALVCFMVQRVRFPRFAGFRAGLLILTLAGALVIWFGWQRIEGRLATLWEGQALMDRVPIWSRTLPLAKEFPVWGTGLGTFQFVEPLQRTRFEGPLIFDHAHNEYLEALVEGGILRLILSLLAIGLVFHLAFRAIRGHEGTTAGWLSLGALFGFTSLVVHSSGDFGIHIPAITVLATVLCAHLCALGKSQGITEKNGATSPETDLSSEQYSLRLGGLAPVLGFGTAVVLGFMLCREGWLAHQVESLRLAASQWGAIPGPTSQAHQIAALEAAVHLAPDDAQIQFDLAEAHFDRYQEQMKKVTDFGKLAVVAQTVSLPTWARTGLAANLAAPSLVVAPMAWEEWARKEERQPGRDHLLPGLRHCLLARDLCPLLGETNLQIAAHVDKLTKADDRGLYLQRAKLLNPSSPELWFLCGHQELADGHPAQTWSSWRRSLELANRFLPEILDTSGKQLGPPEILDQVLPDSPEILVAAAAQLFPGEKDMAGRRPFLKKALVLLEQPTANPNRADQLHLRGLIHASLGEPDEATADFRAALTQNPQQVDWRFELARFLFQQGHLEDSRHELVIVLAQQPGNSQANDLLKIVRRELAKKT